MIFSRILNHSGFRRVGPEIRKRKALRNSMPTVALTEAHTEHCRALPDRAHLLRKMKRDAEVAEIGVADGAFAASILDICRPRSLHLIDAWQQEAYQTGYVTVCQRFQDEIDRGRVTVHRGLSTEKLAGFPDRSLDWVYIDTDHSYETTAAELLEADRVTRADGLILGHDYTVGHIVRPRVFGVVQAVNEFCVRRNWRFKYITLESHGHHSFCLERINE